MPAPFNFPGHYWDEEKGKFFKIENSGTAPAGASWSREQVSHQQQRERLADAARAKRGRGGHLRPTKRIKYNDGEGDDDDDGGDGYIVLPSRAATRLTARLPFLGRETSGPCTPSAPSVSSGHCFEPSLRASAAASYTRSLQYKGTVPVLDEQFALRLEMLVAGRGADTALGAGTFDTALTQPKVLSGTKITCMYIQPDPGPPGLGIVYTNYDSALGGSSIKGQYIMTDADEFVSNKWPTRPPYDKYAMWERTRPELLSIRQPSTISYHESSRNMIVTSCTAGMHDTIIEVFSPHTPNSHQNKGVTWQMGLTQQRGHGATVFPGDTIGAGAINACVPSPRGFDALCVIGTDKGLAVVDLHAEKARATIRPGGGRKTTTLQLPPPAPPQEKPRYNWQPTSTGTAGYIASVDFVHNHPSLVVAGGRFATPWLVDLRENTDMSGTFESQTPAWRSFRPFSPVDSEDVVNAASSIPTRKGKGKGKAKQAKEAPAIVWNSAHVRSVNDHHVVVAGVRDTMVLYDLRYLNAPPARRATCTGWTRAFSPSGSSGSSGSSVYGVQTAAEPLLRFANYYNSDRMSGLGFAVDKELGIVAAAEEHAPYTGLGGGVGLFSLATGERLAAPSLKSTLCHATDTLARIYPSLAATLPTISSSTTPTPTPARVPGVSAINLPRIPVLCFAELPGEQGSSLFAGIGASVHKFSARKIFEDVIDDDEEDGARTRVRQLNADAWYGPDIMPLNAEY